MTLSSNRSSERGIPEDEDLEKLREGVMNGDSESVERKAKSLIEKGISPLKAMDAISKTLLEIGAKFEKSEIFLPDLMMAGDAAKKGTSILLAAVPRSDVKSSGKVIIGTVEGDIHDLGKNIVIAMLEAQGFEVHDLGIDVPVRRFIEEAEVIKPDIVGLSALMTTTMNMMAQIVSAFKELGIREKYKIIVGGSSVTKEFVQKIGADGSAPNAVEAATLARKLVGKS